MTCGIWRFFLGVPPLDSHDESPNYQVPWNSHWCIAARSQLHHLRNKALPLDPAKRKRSKKTWGAKRKVFFRVGLFINQQKNRGGRVRIVSSFQWLKDMYCISQAVARVQVKKCLKPWDSYPSSSSDVTAPSKNHTEFIYQISYSWAGSLVGS